MQLNTDRRIPFDAPVERVWAAMNNVEAYQAWWPWLEKFEAEPIATGRIWRCKVRAPLRYTVSFTLKFDVVVQDQHIETSLRGDIVGGAWIDLEDRGASCDAWIRSSLSPNSGFLKTVSTLAPPVARAGHDWIISTGAKQFEQRALDR